MKSWFPMKTYKRQFGFLIVLLLTVLANLQAVTIRAQSPSAIPIGIENFGKVNDNYFRGSQPDRTGEMTAIYRITHDRWTADQAYQEMKKYDFEDGFFYPRSLKKYVFSYYDQFASQQTPTVETNIKVINLHARPSPNPVVRHALAQSLMAVVLRSLDRVRSDAAGIPVEAQHRPPVAENQSSHDLFSTPLSASNFRPSPEVVFRN